MELEDEPVGGGPGDINRDERRHDHRAASRSRRPAHDAWRRQTSAVSAASTSQPPPTLVAPGVEAQPRGAGFSGEGAAAGAEATEGTTGVSEVCEGRDRTGAGGTLARAKVAQAQPDGYSVLLAGLGTATSVTLYRNLTFNPVDSFDTVGLIARVPMVLVGRKDLPVKDVGELVKYITEINPLRMGKYLPGVRIPIVDEETMFTDAGRADAAVLFAWNYADEIVPRLRERGFAGEIIAP